MLNLFDLTGKVAIVTGGNGGIGLGIARGLAQTGATLALIARNAAKSQEAARLSLKYTPAAQMAHARCEAKSSYQTL